MEKIKICIIGGGASGLFAASCLNDLDAEIYIYEKNNKLGKKILASGNGKCNFTNLNILKECYNNLFGSAIVDKFGVDKTIEKFERMGLIYKKDEAQRCYPISECASSVLDCLKNELSNIKIRLESVVEKVSFQKDKIKVFCDNKVETFDYLICCSGSCSSNLGSSKAYDYLSSLNLKMSKLRPSLTPVVVEEKVSDLMGVRVKCLVSLINSNNKIVYKENGEVIFKKDGLSGIAVFNASSYINRNPSDKYKIVLDISGGKEIDFLKSYFKSKKNTNMLFRGFLNDKLGQYVYERCNLGNIDILKESDLNEIVSKIKNLSFSVKELYPFVDSQVCSGGVCIEEVDENLRLKKYPNIYIGGELLDVDGVCGGYNLQFAWSSAGVISEHIKKIINNKNN